MVIMNSIKNRSVLVTGAYGGMGRATVDILSQNGYRVFALDINADNVKCSDNVTWIKTDITSETALKLAIEMIYKYTDHLDAILHFAGVYILDSLVEMDVPCFEHIFDVNVMGAFAVNKIFMPMLRRGSKVIITTSELAPLDPLPFTGAYAVTKAALDKYAYSLRMELQLLGVDVSVIRAGAVKTKMLGVSTNALDKFCEKTKLYACNSVRFKRIVNGVETRCVLPVKVAQKSIKILNVRRPKFVYNINRNPLLLMLNVLPRRIQCWIIRKILQ